jgi:hypothetical protein
MNERIKELLEQVGVKYVTMPKDTVYEKFAELIVAEFSKVLFDESERLSGLYYEEANWQSAEEYEIRSNQCIDNIVLIEKRLGIGE